MHLFALYQSPETSRNNSKQSFICVFFFLYVSMQEVKLVQNLPRYYLNGPNSQEQPIYFIWTPILFDAFRISGFSASGSWTKITYSYVNESNAGAMDVGTGVFTAPLAGTYQFIIQATEVSHFLLLRHNMTVFYLLTSMSYIMHYICNIC